MRCVTPEVVEPQVADAFRRQCVPEVRWPILAPHHFAVPNCDTFGMLDQKTVRRKLW
jgi:hypothetical protein